LIEAATAMLFVACFLRYGLSFETPAAALFSALMLVLAVIDVDHLLLPDAITWPAVALGILLQPFLPWARLWDSPWGALAGAAFGALVGSGLLLAVWGGWYLLRHEEGMGLGDVKMLAAIGAFLGWKGVAVALFFAALSGATVGLALMAWGDYGARSKLPFGAFLALGGLVALFAGEPLVQAYARLL
jgi:leader peptidase (prepilin peptidase)/N-methyltransferase